jgi:hypothetical protein
MQTRLNFVPFHWQVELAADAGGIVESKEKMTEIVKVCDSVIGLQEFWSRRQITAAILLAFAAVPQVSQQRRKP